MILQHHAKYSLLFLWSIWKRQPKVCYRINFKVIKKLVKYNHWTIYLKKNLLNLKPIKNNTQLWTQWLHVSVHIFFKKPLFKVHRRVQKTLFRNFPWQYYYQTLIQSRRTKNIPYVTPYLFTFWIAALTMKKNHTRNCVSFHLMKLHLALMYIFVWRYWNKLCVSKQLLKVIYLVTETSVTDSDLLGELLSNSLIRA